MPEWLRGRGHPGAKLTDEKARAIFAERPGWWEVGGNNRIRDAGGTWVDTGMRGLAEEYGVSHTIIRRIWNEEAWTHATLEAR